MKRLSLLTILLCLLAGAARAYTANGTVTNATTGLPVASQVITITDTFHTFTMYDTTNSSGVYSKTLPATVTGNAIIVSTTACGVYLVYHQGYMGSANVVTNFSVCAGVPTSYTLHGSVSLGGANNGTATLYLICKNYDPTVMDTTLTLVDSFMTASTGGGYTRTYSALPCTGGTLLLKAALNTSHPAYSSYLPTYYTSSLNWSGATPLTLSNFSPATITNINMVAGTNPGGAGFIGGSVLLGANKSTAVGDPLSKRIILLKNSAGQAVAYTYSNAAGKFSFANIAYGTYKLSGDALGKTNPELAVTISATSQRVEKVVFEENNKTFKGRIDLSVGGNAGVLSGVNVYPNPVTDQVQIGGLAAIAGNKTAVLSTVTGAVIDRQSITSGNTAAIATAALPAGVYMLQLQTEEGSVSFRIIK